MSDSILVDVDLEPAKSSASTKQKVNLQHCDSREGETDFLLFTFVCIVDVITKSTWHGRNLLKKALEKGFVYCVTIGVCTWDSDDYWTDIQLQTRKKAIEVN